MRATGISLQTVSRIVAHLQYMGWVCQRQGPDEGCKRIITLCADAREQSRGGLHPSTTDKRIFSIQLRLSTKFSIDLGGFIDVRFWPMPLLCMF